MKPILLDPQEYPSGKLGDDLFLPVSGANKNRHSLLKFSTDLNKLTPWLNYASNSYVGKTEEFILAQQKPPPCLNLTSKKPMSESFKAMVLERQCVAWLTKISNEMNLPISSL